MARPRNRTSRAIVAIAGVSVALLLVSGSGDGSVPKPQVDPEQNTALPGPLAAPDIEVHLGDAESIKWVKIASLMLDMDESCVDGRDAHAVIGTPGGDVGEFLLALASVERLGARKLAPNELHRLFEAYVNSVGRFYMHTDDHALDQLARDVERDPRLKRHLDAAVGIEALVRAPPREAQEPLLELLTDPIHIGCGHLALVASRSKAYGVRADLTTEVIRTVYRRLWRGDPNIDFVVLTGEHQEGAVVNVVVDEPLHAYSRVPMVAPLANGSEVFVHHPQVVSFLRREYAPVFVEHAGLGDSGLDREQFVEEVERLGERQLALTVGELAAALPVYELRFSGTSHTVQRMR